MFVTLNTDKALVLLNIYPSAQCPYKEKVKKHHVFAKKKNELSILTNIY